MKRITLAGLALFAVFAAVGVSVAQAAAPTMTSAFSVAAAKAPTKKKPANGNFTATFNINPDSDSTLSRVTYTLPKNIKLDGTGFKTCSADQLNASGEADCPKGSKVGTGSATALIGARKTPLNFDVSVFAAGKKKLALYLKTSLFSVAIPATISGQTVTFDIPQHVQQPVAGLYSYVTSVTASLGKQAGISGTTKVKKGKKTVKRSFVSIGSCSKTAKGSVQASFAANPAPPQVASLTSAGPALCS